MEQLNGLTVTEAGSAEAGARAMETLRFLGDAMLATTAEFRAAVGGSVSR